MEYTFSWGWFFIGMLVTAAGMALTLFYRPIADNLVVVFQAIRRYRLYGLVGNWAWADRHAQPTHPGLGWFLGMLFGR